MTPPVALPPPVVLIFAATDPTGGAGLQAGLLSASAIGCHALSVITAVAVRDTLGMAEVLPIDAGWVEEQARTLLETPDMRNERRILEAGELMRYRTVAPA